MAEMQGSEKYFSSERATNLEFVEGSIKTKEHGGSAGFGLRLLKKGRLGFSYFESETEMDGAMKKALALSKYSKKTGFRFCEKRPYPKARTYSEKTASLSERDLRDNIGEIRDAILKYTNKCRIHVNAGTTLTKIENSEGLNAICKYSDFSAYCEAMNCDGFGFCYYSGIEPLRNPAGLGEIAGEMSKEMRGAKKIESGQYNVVLAPEALRSVLEILLPSVSGDWKRKKISKLWNAKGKRVLSEKFSIFDEPTANASSITPFDEEGVPSRNKKIFERGILRNFLYNREIAALEAIKGKKGNDCGDAEGACSRSSYSTKPTISTSNIVIAPGEYADFEKELRHFVLVKSIIGAHTSNTTTGDFGVEANIAFRFNSGKRTPVRGFVLSGNIFNVFNNIIGLEKRQIVYDDMMAPPIAFEDVQIIG